MRAVVLKIFRTKCKKIRGVLPLSFLLLHLLLSPIYAQGYQAPQNRGDVFITIAKYIQKGDPERLSIWFAEDLEFEILGEQVRASKTQAKFIFKDFFDAHPPKKFTILHKSGNPSMRYAIGELQCNSGETFRIILLLRDLNSKQVLVRIRIEK